MMLDFRHGRTTVFGVSRPMEETSTGHVIIRVMPSGSPRAPHPVLLLEDLEEDAVHSSPGQQTNATMERNADYAEAERKPPFTRSDRKYFEHARKKKEARAEKRRHVQCFGCGEMGHYKADCPVGGGRQVPVEYARLAETSRDTEEEAKL